MDYDTSNEGITCFKSKTSEVISNVASPCMLQILNAINFYQVICKQTNKQTNKQPTNKPNQPNQPTKPNQTKPTKPIKPKQTKANQQTHKHTSKQTNKQVNKETKQNKQTALSQMSKTFKLHFSIWRPPILKNMMCMPKYLPSSWRNEVCETMYYIFEHTNVIVD